MAATEVTTISQGVTRNECFWGYVLKGKQDALIASGLVKRGWFIKSGQLDEKGRICRSKSLSSMAEQSTPPYPPMARPLSVCTSRKQSAMPMRSSSGRGARDSSRVPSVRSTSLSPLMIFVNT